MQTANSSEAFLEAVRKAPIIPVLTIERAEQGAPLAEALAAGGITAIEVTLRTPAAREALAAAVEAVPDLLVGAGTILNGAHLESAADAGAAFGVSPGASAELLQAAAAWDRPFLPGVGSASEVMAAQAAGFRLLKLFPAAPLGGPAALKALGGPFPEVGFCPTGGISAQDALSYLKLGNVFCVGGSWVAPADLVRDGAWNEIERLARDSLAALRDAA